MRECCLLQLRSQTGFYHGFEGDKSCSMWGTLGVVTGKGAREGARRIPVLPGCRGATGLGCVPPAFGMSRKARTPCGRERFPSAGNTSMTGDFPLVSARISCINSISEKSGRLPNKQNLPTRSALSLISETGRRPEKKALSLLNLSINPVHETVCMRTNHSHVAHEQPHL
mgnify:CR=1 FL=1